MVCILKWYVDNERLKNTLCKIHQQKVLSTKCSEILRNSFNQLQM